MVFKGLGVLFRIGLYRSVAKLALVHHRRHNFAGASYTAPPLPAMQFLAHGAQNFKAAKRGKTGGQIQPCPCGLSALLLLLAYMKQYVPPFTELLRRRPSHPRSCPTSPTLSTRKWRAAHLHLRLKLGRVQLRHHQCQLGHNHLRNFRTPARQGRWRRR